MISRVLEMASVCCCSGEKPSVYIILYSFDEDFRYCVMILYSFDYDFTSFVGNRGFRPMGSPTMNP